MLPKKTRGDTVSLSLRLNLGDEKSLMGRSPAGGLVAAMLLRGTAHHTRQQIEDEFDRLKANVIVSGDETSLVATLDTVRQHFPDALRLLLEVLRAPSFPETELEELRHTRLAALEAARSDPQTLASLALYRHGNPYPRGHVRYVDNLDEQIAATQAAKLETIKAFHGEFYGASHSELAVVGDFDPKDLQALVAATLSEWKSRTPYARVRDPYHDVPAAELSIEIHDKPNAVYMAREPLPVTDGDADHPALLLGNYILGGSGASRLLNRVRQKEGLSYSVGSSITWDSFDRNSNFSLYAIYAPQNRARVASAMTDEVNRLLRQGVTAEEVKRAKEAIGQERRLALTYDPALAAILALDLRLGRTMRHTEAVDRALAALTPDQVTQALRKYVHLEGMPRVFAGEFATRASTQ